VTSRIGPDVLLLEAADGCAGQWPEDAVYRSFVMALIALFVAIVYGSARDDGGGHGPECV
jgi:hypothetical protein